MSAIKVEPKLEYNSPNCAYFDITKQALSTIKLRRSHLRKIESAGYNVCEMTNDDVIDFIKQLQRSGKVKDSYLSTIISTIRSVNQNITITGKSLKLKRLSSKPSYSNNDVTAIKEFLKDSIIFLVTYQEPQTRSEFDAKLAAVLVFLTNLRASEILQLSITDLERIKNNQNINIKIKNRNLPLKIIKLDEIFNRLYPYIIENLARRNTIYDNDLTSEQKTKVITTSIVAINSFIKFQLTINSSKFSEIKTGLQIIRKFTTSRFIENDLLSDAQNINRHRDQNVTIDNYNLIKTEDLDSVFS